jgi:dienelactone hydrolase
MGGRMRAAAGCLIAAVVLATLGTVGLVHASSTVASRDLVVDGVHLLEVRPQPGDEAPRSLPGVVVVHGFAGSAILMRGFADTLAAQGYVVVLPDLAGHGTDADRLPLSDERGRPPESDVDAAVRHLRSLRDVDLDRIALIGHSMGAGLVTQYAASHRGVRATVAISLPSADDLIADPVRPHNLLLIVGGAEFPGFHDTVADAMTAGAAQRAVTVPGVEHISVLYATRTHEEAAAWLATAMGVTPRTDAVHPRDRLLPAAALLAAFVLAFVPLALLVLPRRDDDPPPGRRVRIGAGAVGLCVGLVAAVSLANIAPTTLLPIAVGGHATGFFALAGLGLIGGWAIGRSREQARWPRARTIAAAVVLMTYAAAAIVVPAQLGLTHMIPVGDRWWLLPIVAAGTFLLLLGTELVATDAGWRRPVILAATVAALLAATLAGLAPGFGLLVLPLLAILLGWQAGWAWWLRRLEAPAWLAAAVGAVVVAWPIAATLPLI